ncbi:tetratricopeptide repeat protein [Qipengyuania sp. JC766]|uniref:tetratricopeptide repeat protein n=1 Tax=Qipengyuania sp. JC766 TaxID=3232139 RepID=UPI003459DA2D
MARKPDAQSEITKKPAKNAEGDVLMREVDEAVRQDNFANFAKRFGVPILALVAVALLAFGGYLWWDRQNEAAAEEQSETLISALDQIEAGNLETGSAALDGLATEGEGGARAAAAMLQGGIALERGDSATAAERFAAVAADEAAPPAMRDLAVIREVAARFDTMQPAEVIRRLQPLAVEDNAYFGSAGELVAIAYLEQGKRQEAGDLLSRIARNEDVPEGLRARTRQLAGFLGVDAIEDVEELLEEQAGPAPAGAAPPQQAPASEN